MRKILVILSLLFIVGCASYHPSTEYTFVKVLGVTPQGDTILIDVNSLRPKFIITIIMIIRLTDIPTITTTIIHQ